MVSKILYLRMKKAVKRLNRSLDEKKRLIRIYKRRTADLRRRLAKVSREKAVLEDGYVVEWCLHCETADSHALGCKRRWRWHIAVLRQENDAMRTVPGGMRL